MPFSLQFLINFQVVGASIAAGKEMGKESSPAEAWNEKGAEADKVSSPASIAKG